ncbi:MAG: carbamoyltransferase [Elusimicrobia bacterium]|nr:carbamoyltransferase [Elusimicrobiota bacterium]
MSKLVLGLSAYYHDSAAALVRDGEIVAAAQEERFTRVKHDRNFPAHAVDYCLKEAGIGRKDLDLVVYYDKPLLTFDRLLETYLAYAPRGFRSFAAAMPVWIHEKLRIPDAIDEALGADYGGRIDFCLHHLSHAASAFYPSPFESAAVLTMDGVGEWSTATLGVGRGKDLKLVKEIRFPHSLGLLYSAFTYYLGFKVNSGEYKVMGLAPYGQPKYKELITKRLIDVKADGSLHMDMSYFNYCAGLTMTNGRFHDLFGGGPRSPESKLNQRDMDLAASIQSVTEEIMLLLARHARKETGEKNLCLAGGVALNCVGNGLIMREQVFDKLFIQPAAGDAGGALGAALFGWHHQLDGPRAPRTRDALKGSLLGPACRRDDVLAALQAGGYQYRELADAVLVKELAELLDKQQVIGLVRGRMEFGPRALGSRSIIGDPRAPDMQKKMNLKIKFRESFRPFAPAVLEADAGKYFGLSQDSPYMLLVGPVAEAQRSKLPAVTHVDHSARVQTVSKDDNPFFHSLLEAFKAKTGCSVLVNTSFNVRGEPIVCDASDALRCFMNTDMDALVIENFLLLKSEQPKSGDREKYLKEFAPD